MNARECITAQLGKKYILPELQHFKPFHCVRNIGGIFLNCEFKCIPHIKNTTKIGFDHLKHIVRVRSFLSLASTEMLLHAFMFSRLD